MTKIVTFLCTSEHMSPSTRVEKLMSARGEGGIFCQKLTEADNGGVKIDQILADVICEDPLAQTCHTPVS